VSQQWSTTMQHDNAARRQGTATTTLPAEAAP
jgi:hypothetical protein